MLFLIILLFIIIPPAYEFVAYDCGGRYLNVTTVSLLDIDDCDLQPQNPTSTEVYIQLLQLSEYNYAEVTQCKVEISRTIYHCGMHSHVSVVQNGRIDYLHETGYTTCTRMLNDGILQLGTAGSIQRLRPNQTSHHSITLAGTIEQDGKCKGTQYSDPYGTWNEVIVQAVVKISLKSSYASVHLNTGRIILKSGTTCALSEGFCIDSDDGYSYWKPMPSTSCDFHQYDVLYEGPATKFKDDDTDFNTPAIYSLTTRDVTFALTKTTEQSLCGYTLMCTEHPKLFILETKKGDTIVSKESVPVNNLDIFTYVNSKFVYVEKHIRSQMTSLYHNIIQQKCKLEMEVLKNTLSIASILPDEFSFRFMKGPGYMAITAGEVIHIIKCIPVNVMIRRVDRCYTELPITIRNSSQFAHPKSHIITKFGTERECNNLLPVTYRIEDMWLQFSPQPIEVLTPQRLQPMTTLSWKYLTPTSLATSGIYSERDLEKLRDHIMFPVEKPAVLNTIARGMAGHSMQDTSFSMYNLLDEKTLNKIVQTTASRIWGGFITFGSASAGVLGIFMIIRLIKLLIDTIIHGYALYSVLGCGFHLLGAVWSSLTNLLIHLAQRTKPDFKKNHEDIKKSHEEQNVRSATAPPQESANVLPEPTTTSAIFTYKDLRDQIINLEQISH